MLNFLKKKKTYESDLKELKKRYPDEDLSKKYKLEKNDLDLEYKKIDAYEHDKNQIDIMSAEMKKIDVQEDLLKLDLKYNKIDAIEYERRINDLHKNPWAKIHFNYDENNDPENMQTEIVYNDYFIKKLQSQGYSGKTNDDIIQSWLSQVFASNVEPGDLDLEGNSDEYVANKKVKNTFIVG